MESSPFAIKNVRLFVLFRLFFNSRFYYPVFTILFIDFGLSVAQFALLNALWAACIVFLEVPSGALADIIGRKSLLVATGILMIAEMLFICCAPRGNPDVLFVFFLINRIFSGAAEAFASGADEAIAYDSLKAEGRVKEWGRVLDIQMRVQSIGFIAAMSIGAAVYDPALMQKIMTLMGVHVSMTQNITLRIPVFMTLASALCTLWTVMKISEPPMSLTAKALTPIRAFSLTLGAGKWILSTPFAMAIILAGLAFDSISRMVVTLSSQYYRIVHVPEALFGILGSAVAVTGLFIPRIARWMVENRSPAFNFFSVGIIICAGLTGMNFFIPIYGLVPALVLFSSMSFTRFFVSHYLNNITSSHRRATVLSFKGLSFNLFYGIIGILYSVLLAIARPRITSRLENQGGEIENFLFITSFKWFLLAFIVLFFLVWLFAAYRLRGSDPPTKKDRARTT